MFNWNEEPVLQRIIFIVTSAMVLNLYYDGLELTNVLIHEKGPE